MTVISLIGFEYTDAAKKCFSMVDCGIFAGGCKPYCVEKLCVGTAECVGNMECCCGGCIFG